MKVYSTVIAVCFYKFHIWENSGSWDMARNSLAQSELQDFSINCRTLKLAVSHKEVNETNLFLVRPSNSFLRNGSLDISHFWHSGRQFEYWKTDRVLFSRKIHFWPKLGQKVPSRMAAKKGFFFFFLNFGHVSFSEKLSIMKTNIVFDISPTYLV